MNFKDIVLGVDSLPPLIDTAKTVERLYAEGAENVNIAELVRVIESDASLTANILKMINAPYYGFSRKITSVAQAVTLFGTQMIYGLVLQYSISSSIIANVRPYGVSSRELNDISHLQSALMNQWFSKVDMFQAQYLAPLALIMESGKLLVAREIVKNGVHKAFQEGFENAQNCTEFEHNFFGTTSYFVSGMLFEHWNLDSVYADALKGLDYEQNNTNPRMEMYIDAIDVVRTSVNVKGVFETTALKTASEIVEDMRLKVDDFLLAAKTLKQKHTF